MSNLEENYRTKIVLSKISNNFNPVLRVKNIRVYGIIAREVACISDFYLINSKIEGFAMKFMAWKLFQMLQDIFCSVIFSFWVGRQNMKF